MITAYADGKLHDILARADAKYNASRTHSLRRDEAALLYLLQRGQDGKSLRRAVRQAAKVC